MIGGRGHTWGEDIAGWGRRPKRLDTAKLAYLEDLAKIGAYGKDKSGVMRRFIENSVRTAIERKVIQPRDVADFGSDEDE